LVPNLGIVQYRDGKSFVMADIPGIIEGAAEGKGLGLRFLRHIERNSILLFIVPADCDSILKEYEILLHELEKYNPELIAKRRILAISKCEIIDEELTEAFEDLLVMVKNIQAMEAAQYEAEIKEQNILNEQQKMEFKMLASQINPHFLYNTLETIRMKAFTAGDKEVATAIKLLGKSMRYVLENTGTTDTTLQAELDHIIIYLKIQQLRFGDRVNYETHIREGMNLEEYRVLPLLLQPIVENAIVHGLEAKEKDGKVRFSIYTMDDVVYVDVSDNGCGMDEEMLRTVMTKVQDYTKKRRKSSIGLYNINRRIKLNYGEQYGLDIQSTPGEGTTVRVTFPAIKSEKETKE